MPTVYNSKIMLADGTVLLDISEDTVVANKLLDGFTAHKANGEPITGTCPFDADTSSDTALAGEILSGKTAHARGSLLTGTMTNRGAVSGQITSAATPYTIQQGYHDGSGTVSISSQTLTEGNIKSGVNILGVTGTYTGEAISAETRNITPTLTAQTITPSSGYDYIAQVNLAAIPIDYTVNASGGNTVTIG